MSGMISEILYDGTPESGNAVVAFACGIDPGNCIGGRIWVLGIELNPGDVLVKNFQNPNGWCEIGDFSVKHGVRH